MSENDSQNEKTAEQIKADELQVVIQRLEEIKAAAEKSLADAKAGKEPTSLADVVTQADQLKAKARQASERQRIAELLAKQTEAIDKHLAPVLKTLFAEPGVMDDFKNAQLTKFVVTFSETGLPLVSADTLKKAARRANGGRGNGTSVPMPAGQQFYLDHTNDAEKAADKVLLDQKIATAMANPSNTQDEAQMRNSRWDSVKKARLWGANGTMQSRYADEAKTIQGTK